MTDTARLRKALLNAVVKSNDALRVMGTLGRYNSDSTVTYRVTGRRNRLYVKLRTSEGAQITVIARDDLGVPHARDLPVELKVEQRPYGVSEYVITAQPNRDDLAEQTERPASGLPPHTHDDRYYRETEFITASVGAADAGKPVATDANGALGTTLLAPALNAATGKTTPVDADTLPLIDSAASNVLKKLTWANLKTTLSALFVLLAGKAGGQHIKGGTAASEDLTLESTNHATKGHVIVQPVGGNVIIGATTPGAPDTVLTLEREGAFCTLHITAYHTVAAGGARTGVNAYAAQGTKASPAAMGAEGQVIYRMTGNAHDTVDFRTSSRIEMLSDGAHSSGATPGRIDFLTTPPSSTTLALALRINSAQRVDFSKFLTWSGQKAITANFDKTNTTLATITGLSVTVEAGKFYNFRAVLWLTVDATGGYKLAVAGTATATAIRYQVHVRDAATGAVTSESMQTALGGAGIGAAPGGTSYFVEIGGRIRVNAAGTLLLQFAQNAANGTSSVLADSHFIVEEMAA